MDPGCLFPFVFFVASCDARRFPRDPGVSHEDTKTTKQTGGIRMGRRRISSLHTIILLRPSRFAVESCHPEHLRAVRWLRCPRVPRPSPPPHRHHRRLDPMLHWATPTAPSRMRRGREFKNLIQTCIVQYQELITIWSIERGSLLAVEGLRVVENNINPNSRKETA